MATGTGRQDLSHSQLNAGDELLNHFCTPCQKRNKNQAALKYCPVCLEYMCTECVDSHNSFQSFSKHVLMDLPHVPVPSTSRKIHQLMSVTEMCKKHPMKAMDMYCGDDDCVGCSVCIAPHYKSCRDIHYIPEYVMSEPTDAQHDQKVIDLFACISDVSTLKNLQLDLKQKLENEKAECKQKIQNYRMEIKKVVDQLEQKSLRELDEAYRTADEEIENRIRDIEKMEKELARLKRELEISHVNKSQKFAIAKVAQEMITESVNLAAALNVTETTSLQFDENVAILQQLHQYESLQEIKTSLTAPQIPGEMTSPSLQDTDYSIYSTVKKLAIAYELKVGLVPSDNWKGPSLQTPPTKPVIGTPNLIDDTQLNDPSSCKDEETGTVEGLSKRKGDLTPSICTDLASAATPTHESPITGQGIDDKTQRTSDSMASIYSKPLDSETSRSQDELMSTALESSVTSVPPMEAGFGQWGHEDKTKRETVSRGDKETGSSEDITQHTSDFMSSVYIPQYVVKSKARHNVGIQADKMTCNISSLCILDNGNLLMTDFNNKCIKEMDKKKGRVIDSISVSSSPICVSRVNARESVVSLQSKTIQFITKSGVLSSTRSFKTGHRCCGLAVIKNNLYVCDDNTSVHVYTLNGDRTKTIRYRSETYLTAMDIQGKRLWQRTDMKSQPTGLCCDNHGNLFVCGRSEGNVVLVNQDGKGINEIVGRRDGLSYPSSVCLNKEGNKLILGMQGSNEILVFSLSCFIKTNLPTHM